MSENTFHEYLKSKNTFIEIETVSKTNRSKRSIAMEKQNSSSAGKKLCMKTNCDVKNP